LAFFIGIITAFGYSYWKTNKIPTINKPKNKKLAFSIDAAPKNSIKGKIESLSGKVKWESRTATAPSEIIKSVIIQQGETLETGEDGNATIIFPEILTINLSSQSKLSITQTLPTNFVFDQSNGSITYEKNGQTPISIRSLHLLTAMNSGKIILTIDKETAEITISVKKGSATAAFNDLENLSNVVNIKEGEKFVFNDDTREASME